MHCARSQQREHETVEQPHASARRSCLDGCLCACVVEPMASFGSPTPLLPTAADDNVRVSVWSEHVGKELAAQVRHASSLATHCPHTERMSPPHRCAASRLQPPI